MEARILDYREGVWNFNSEEAEKAKGKPLEMKISSTMKMRRDKSIFGFQMTFEFTAEKTLVLKYGFVLAMVVPGWIPITSADKIDEGSRESMKRNISEIVFSRAPEQLSKVCHAVIDFSRGAIAGKMGSNPSVNGFFPEVEMERFLPTIDFQIIPEKK